MVHLVTFKNMMINKIAYVLVLLFYSKNLVFYSSIKIDQIKHLGQYTPESVGDYASGTNHVLPTYGYAKMYSGVSLDSFVKKITV